MHDTPANDEQSRRAGDALSASTAGAQPHPLLAAALLFMALVVAAVGSLGTSLITRVAATYHVSLAAAQWTLTLTLLSGAVATPVLARLGSGVRRRATTLSALTIATVGSLCTVLAGPFWLLLAGRAAQGVGLGLTALLMAAARDAFSRLRAGQVIAMLSVASTAGVGVGYPLAGALADLGGARMAYAAGLAVTAAALLIGVRFLPLPPAGRLEARVDVRGAVLLGSALAAVLIPVSDQSLWQRDRLFACALLGAGIVLLATWVVVERRTTAPLVDLSSLRQPVVARANATMLLSGVSMYLLLTLSTRYAQTPTETGYGFGLNTFQAGLVLVPFSAAGFVAGRAVPRLAARSGPTDWPPEVLCWSRLGLRSSCSDRRVSSGRCWL